MNWQPAAHSPKIGLFRVPEDNGYSIFYLTELDPRNSMGLGGRRRQVSAQVGITFPRSTIEGAKVVGRHSYYGNGGSSGLLATAGNVLLPGDSAATSLHTTPQWANRYGMRESVTFRTRHRHICWMGGSM